MSKVIIIDDEPLARSIVKEYLESRPDLELVAECGDGFEGVEAALQRAALRAREIAAQTGTPLVIWKNGKIVKLMISPKEVTKASRK